MPFSFSGAKSALVNSAATFATPRNVGRYFGYEAMQATVEFVWGRQLKGGDLAAALTGRFVAGGPFTGAVAASWGLLSFPPARKAGGSGTGFRSEPPPANRVVLGKLAKA